jgi:putative ABC transport system substrate-binding protein
MGTDLAAKRLELLRVVSTGLARLAIMAYNGAAGAMLEMHTVQATARTIGLEPITLEITAGNRITPMIAALKSRADALYVCPDPLINANRVPIVTSALIAGLPTVFGER